MAKELREKQRKFADEYLKCGVAYQAAIKAGYKEKYANTHSHKMLENIRIKEYIKKAQEEMRSNAIASAEEVLAFLTSTMKNGDERTGDRLKAAELLGKRHALFTDKVDMAASVDSTNRTVDITNLSDEEIERKLAQLGVDDG